MDLTVAKVCKFALTSAGLAESAYRRSVTNFCCFDLQIKVTIGIEWNECIVGKPIPPRYETQVTQGTVLAEVLNKAAGECCPYNKYQSTYYGNDDLGHMITAMDGVLDVCIWFFASLLCWPEGPSGQFRQIPHAQNQSFLFCL